MANKNILTSAAKVTQIRQTYYSPVAVIQPNLNTPLASIYCFLAKVDPWPDENNPVVPTQTQSDIKKIFKNIFAVKNISSGSISPVIQRVDWTSGVVYDYYRDDINITAQDTNQNNLYNFYVKNRYDQVFKCLWNNNSVASTYEPYFQPGSYGTNNIYTGPDGYQWKYIYTVDIGSKIKFMDTNWIPVPAGTYSPNPLLWTAGTGSIDVVNVINGGSGYDTANAPVSIVVSGDGTGFAATANVAGGAIQNIIVTTPGSNYTYANVSVVSASGSGAIVQSPVSPVGGHGADPVSELGCSHVMYTVEFNGSEGGLIPTDIDYHQVGLIFNPTTTSLSPYVANGSVYSTTTDIVVSPGFGAYTNDEFIYQGQSSSNTTFSGLVLSFNTSTNVVKVLNTSGTITTNQTIYGQSSGTARTLLSYNTPNFVLNSGYLAFIENRTGVQRSSDGIEQFRFVLGY
jgi:hypothetical protein